MQYPLPCAAAATFDRLTMFDPSQVQRWGAGHLAESARSELVMFLEQVGL